LRKIFIFISSFSLDVIGSSRNFSATRKRFFLVQKFEEFSFLCQVLWSHFEMFVMHCGWWWYWDVIARRDKMSVWKVILKKVEKWKFLAQWKIHFPIIHSINESESKIDRKTTHRWALKSFMVKWF
jgi:hypothetical protein